MGWLSKTVKKVTKGLKSAVKKVSDGIKKVGGKIMKATGLDKVVNKLGPLGMMAIGFIAPYAVGWMAASSNALIATIGQGLQAVGTTIAAPFKAAGDFIGGAIAEGGAAVGSAVGQNAVGNTITSITSKIGTALGYDGTGILESAKGEFAKVSQAWKDIGNIEAISNKAITTKTAGDVTAEATEMSAEEMFKADFDELTAGNDPFADTSKWMNREAPTQGLLDEQYKSSLIGDVPQQSIGDMGNAAFTENTESLLGRPTGLDADKAMAMNKEVITPVKGTEAVEVKAAQKAAASSNSGTSLTSKVLGSLLAPQSGGYAMQAVTGGAGNYGDAPMLGGTGSSYATGMKMHDKYTGFDIDEANRAYRRGRIL